MPCIEHVQKVSFKILENCRWSFKHKISTDQPFGPTFYSRDTCLLWVKRILKLYKCKNEQRKKKNIVFYLQFLIS